MNSSAITDYTPMTIAVLGAGPVGQALFVRLRRAGHAVVFGVRDPSSPTTAAALQRANVGADAAQPIAAAAAGAQVLVLAIPFSAAPDVVSAVGDFAGKVVIDATNPLSADGSALTLGFDTSAAEEIARLAPGARVVKAFNTTGAVNMADPVYEGRPLAMPYAADDAEAKQIAARLIADVGFHPVDAGPLSNSRLLEPIAMLWIWLAFRGGFGRGFAFDLAKRDDRPLSELLSIAVATPAQRF